MSRMRALAPRMIGRQAQVQELEEHLRQLRAGSCRVVLVAGEAGVGKTRLLRAFLEHARATDGAEVLQGYCFEEQPAAAYGPFIGAIRGLLRARGAEPVIAAAGPLRGDLLPLFPELGFPTPMSADIGDPQSQKQRLFEALYRVLRPQGAGRCRIVVLEDLHWADQTSLELLRYLTRAGEGEALLLLGSYRTDELHRGHPLGHLLAQLTRDRELHEVQIAPLPPDDLAQMLEVTLERAVPEPFAAVMADRTGGNPFFVEEVLRTLLDQGQLDEAIQHARAGRAGLLPVVPPSVQESIRRRTSDLDQVTDSVLRYAAVIGRQFDLELLLRVTGLKEEALLRTIEHLVDLQIVAEDRGQVQDRYSFRHALSREAIYNDLLGLDRRRRHRAVLDALEALYTARGEAALDQLAYHSLQAGERTTAARYTEQAGNRGARMYAFREAMGHYQTALELRETRDSLTYAELLMKLAAVAFPLGDTDVYERCWREARQFYERIGDRRTAGDLATRLGHTAKDRGDMEAALAHFNAAIDLLESDPPGPELAMAYSLLGNYYRSSGRPEEAVAWGEKALRLADALKATRVRADALLTIGTALRDLGESQRAADHLTGASRPRHGRPNCLCGRAGLTRPVDCWTRCCLSLRHTADCWTFARSWPWSVRGSPTTRGHAGPWTRQSRSGIRMGRRPGATGCSASASMSIWGRGGRSRPGNCWPISWRWPSARKRRLRMPR